MKAKIQLRNDTAANWRLQNPVLDVGELGIETDTKKIKMGDGKTYWNTLPYIHAVAEGGDASTINGSVPYTKEEVDKAFASKNFVTSKIPTNNNQLANGAGYITEDSDILGKAQFADRILDNDNSARQITLHHTLTAFSASLVKDPSAGCAVWDLGFDNNPKLIRIQWANVAALVRVANEASSASRIMSRADTEKLLPKRYIVDTFNDGDNWYEKYNDGWVRQGGVFHTADTGNYVWKHLDFILPFKDLHFYLNARGNWATSSDATFSKRTTTGVEVYFAVKGVYKESAWWYAEGYGA